MNHHPHESLPQPEAPCAVTLEANLPRPTLRMQDAVALIVGIVVGAGIFKTPQLVAAYAPSATMAVTAWVLGGIISLIGALCYAELATTNPHAGGDYHYLSRAFGLRLSFLFAWARMTVLQTGSLALLAFVFGDYASTLLSLGPFSTPLYAALVIVTLTLLNSMGVGHGMFTQSVLTCVEVLGVILVIVVGLATPPSVSLVSAPPAESSTPAASFGMMMVFVLLTYGGWNEAVYVSAELRNPQRDMVRSLLIGITVITALYVLVNFSYLRALGLGGMASSNAVAADVMYGVLGQPGTQVMGLLVAISALTSANATIITGARTNYALGQDFPPFAFLGYWSKRTDAPINALAAQGIVALALVLLGSLTRKGFETIVEYTAPVFWFFFLLTGISLFVLRRQEPQRERPFRVPLYPLTPLVFCCTSAYLLYASLAYTGKGALVGMGVLLAGVILQCFWFSRPRPQQSILS